MGEQPRQLGLFGDPEPTGVQSHPVSDELRDLASRLPAGLRLGTSSWSFPGWQGIVWRGRHTPSLLSREGLGAYAAHPLLRTVSVDRTYYAPLTADELAAHADQVPSDFRFVVKAPSQLTADRLRGSGDDNPDFLASGFAEAEVVRPFVDGLGDRGGVLLLQFPPLRWHTLREPGRFLDRLGGFLSRLPSGPTYAVELRDSELLRPALVQILKDSSVQPVLSLHPRLPPLSEQIRLFQPLDKGPLVVRWMLRSGLTYEMAKDRYRPFDRLVDEDPANRSTLARLCVAAVRSRACFVLANNKAEGSAPLTLQRLAEAVAALSPP